MRVDADVGVPSGSVYAGDGRVYSFSSHDCASRDIEMAAHQIARS